MQRKIFGEKIETEKYNERIASYVVLNDKGRIAIVRTPSGKYFFLENNNSYSHVTGHFYYADRYEKECEPLEEGNEVLWMPFEECMQELYHPHHRWAVECIKDRLL